MRSIIPIILTLLFPPPFILAQGLTIQENEPGFCSVDGFEALSQLPRGFRLLMHLEELCRTHTCLFRPDQIKSP